jgi:hypothetical protein
MTTFLTASCVVASNVGVNHSFTAFKMFCLISILYVFSFFKVFSGAISCYPLQSYMLTPSIKGFSLLSGCYYRLTHSKFYNAPRCFFVKMISPRKPAKNNWVPKIMVLRQ